MSIEGSYRDLQSISVLAAPERMFHSTSSFVESQVTCAGGIASASQPRDEEPSGGTASTGDTYRRGIRELAPEDGQPNEDCVVGVSHAVRVVVMLAGVARDGDSLGEL